MKESLKQTQVKLLAGIFGIAGIVLLLDQTSKWLALSKLTPGEPVKVFGQALQWVLVKNSGAAFSFLQEATWVFTIISSSVVIFIIVASRKITSPRTAIVAGLVLGGASGNLVDRFFREPGVGIGHVIDFIFTPWIVPAVYNIADIAIVFGMGLFLLFTLFPGRKND